MTGRRGPVRDRPLLAEGLATAFWFVVAVGNTGLVFDSNQPLWLRILWGIFAVTGTCWTNHYGARFWRLLRYDSAHAADSKPSDDPAPPEHWAQSIVTNVDGPRVRCACTCTCGRGWGGPDPDAVIEGLRKHLHEEGR